MTNKDGSVSLDKAVPITDIEGLSNYAYGFSIENTCDNIAKYEINLESVNQTSNTLADENIRVSISSDTFANIISTLTENEKIVPTLSEAYSSHNLYTGKLYAHERKNFYFREWMDYNTTKEEGLNKIYQSKISIVTNPNIEVAEEPEIEFMHNYGTKTVTSTITGEATTLSYCETGDNECDPNKESTLTEEESRITCFYKDNEVENYDRTTGDNVTEENCKTVYEIKSSNKNKKYYDKTFENSYVGEGIFDILQRGQCTYNGREVDNFDRTTGNVIEENCKTISEVESQEGYKEYYDATLENSKVGEGEFILSDVYVCNYNGNKVENMYWNTPTEEECKNIYNANTEYDNYYVALSENDHVGTGIWNAEEKKCTIEVDGTVREVYDFDYNDITTEEKCGEVYQKYNNYYSGFKYVGGGNFEQLYVCTYNGDKVWDISSGDYITNEEYCNSVYSRYGSYYSGKVKEITNGGTYTSDVYTCKYNGEEVSNLNWDAPTEEECKNVYNANTEYNSQYIALLDSDYVGDAKWNAEEKTCTIEVDGQSIEVHDFNYNNITTKEKCGKVYSRSAEYYSGFEYVGSGSYELFYVCTYDNYEVVDINNNEITNAEYCNSVYYKYDYYSGVITNVGEGELKAEKKYTTTLTYEEEPKTQKIETSIGLLDVNISEDYEYKRMMCAKLDNGKTVCSNPVSLEMKGPKFIYSSCINGTDSETHDNGNCDEQTNGLYAQKTSLGTTYYYRGTVNNNWVKFGKMNETKEVWTGYYSATSTNSFRYYSSSAECNGADDYNVNCTLTYFSKPGDDIWWRIIRINEDGTLRLMYAGIGDKNTVASIDNIGGYGGYWISENYGINGREYPFSLYGSGQNNADVGYVYGTRGSTTYELEHGYDLIEQNRQSELNSSNAKTEIDKWYEANLVDEGYMLSGSTGFCGDRTIAEYKNYNNSYTNKGYGREPTYYKTYDRVRRNYEPSYECPNEKYDLYTTKEEKGKGNGALTNPIGLITADEVVYAGKGAYHNYSFWLYTGQEYWTISPESFDSGIAHMITVTSSGYFSNGWADLWYSLYPVVNLKPEYIQPGGDGTIDNPYVTIPN